MRTIAQGKTILPQSENYGFAAIANPIPGLISIFLFLSITFALLKYLYDLVKYSRKNILQNSTISMLTGAISGVVFLVSMVLAIGLALQFTFVWVFVVFYFIIAVFSLPIIIMKPIENRYNSNENGRFLYTSVVFLAHFVVIFAIYQLVLAMVGPEAIFGPGYYF